jgi:hypothetical protein
MMFDRKNLVEFLKFEASIGINIIPDFVVGRTIDISKLNVETVKNWLTINQEVPTSLTKKKY